MNGRVEILLPLWGKRHVEVSLGSTIASLLAPGNLPVLARDRSVDLVFLTSRDDAREIERHPVIDRVRDHAGCSFLHIDDLIADGTYGIVLTLALARAMFRHGAAMTELHFVPMMSDFVLADGSLAALAVAIDAGYPAVFAPSWRAAADAVAPSLERWRDAGGALVAPKRALAALALRHPHASVLAAIAPGGALRTAHYNQLYWPVNEDARLARQLLMHLFCIRPERDISEIKGFFDYVLFECCCPSGRYAVLGDSDQFMALELQASDSEFERMSWGVATPQEIAADLGSWTTAVHRLLGHHSCVLHSAELPERAARVAGEAEGFMARIYAMLPPPMPLGGHPYWEAAIAGLDAVRDAQRPRQPQSLKHRLITIAVRRVFGTPGNVTPLHPRWSEYRAIRLVLGRAIRTGMRVAACSASREVMQGLIGQKVAFLNLEQLAQGGKDLAEWDVVVLDLGPEELPELGRALAGLRARLGERAEIVLIMRRDTVTADRAGQLDFRLGALRAIAASGFACREVHADGGPIGDLVIAWGRVTAAQIWVGRGLRIVASVLKATLAVGLALFGNLADLLWPTSRNLLANARVVVLRLPAQAGEPQ